MADIKATEIAAWWGAVVATVVFLWDIYKWKHSGADVQVTASPDMKTFGNVPQGMDGNTFVVVEAVNFGARRTTLTHLITVYYSSLWQLLIRKRSKQFFTPNPAVDKPLPCELDPGSRWMGAVLQNPELEEMSRNGYLYCSVHHTASRKAVLRRVKVPEKPGSGKTSSLTPRPTPTRAKHRALGTHHGLARVGVNVKEVSRLPASAVLREPCRARMQPLSDRNRLAPVPTFISFGAPSIQGPESVDSSRFRFSREIGICPPDDTHNRMDRLILCF